MSQATLTNVAPTTIAQTSEAVHNQLLAVPELREMIDFDLRASYRNGLDDLVIDTLVAAAGNTANQGADTQIDALVKCADLLAQDGHDPRILVIPDGAALVIGLSKDGVDRYYFGDTPLAQFKIVVSNLLPENQALVLDPAFIKVSLSPVFLDVDSYTGFRTNESRIRFEGTAACFVKQPNAVGLLTLA